MNLVRIINPVISETEREQILFDIERVALDIVSGCERHGFSEMDAS